MRRSRRRPFPRGPHLSASGDDRGALLILNYDVVDLSALERYRAAATHAIEGTFGRVLVSTSTTTHLAEAPRRGARSVVISYPSRQEAERCYWSSEYQRLLPDRMAATTPHVALLVDLIPERGLRIERCPSRDTAAYRLLTAAARWARR